MTGREVKSARRQRTCILATITKAGWKCELTKRSQPRMEVVICLYKVATYEQGSKRLPLRVKATQTQQCYSRSARSQRVSLRAEPTGLSPRGANDLCVRGEDMHWSAQVCGEDQYSSAQVRRRIHVNMYV